MSKFRESLRNKKRANTSAPKREDAQNNSPHTTTGSTGALVGGDRVPEQLAFLPDGSMNYGRFKLSTTGIKELPMNMQENEWKALGEVLQRMDSSVQWLVGDWLVAGEQQYGEKYQDICEQVGFVYSTISNWKSVSNKTEFYLRRENLAWSHHELVTKYKDEPAYYANGEPVMNETEDGNLYHVTKQDYYLHIADSQGFTVSAFRAWLRDVEGKKRKELQYTSADVNAQLNTVMALLNGDIDSESNYQKQWRALIQLGQSEIKNSQQRQRDDGVDDA